MNDISPTMLIIVGIVCAFAGYGLVSLIIGFFSKGSTWEDEWKEGEDKKPET